MKRAAIILVFIFACCRLPAANDAIDSDMNWKIRQEETENSQIMRLLHNITDVYGPRLTGSPVFKSACDWALEQMRSWGLQNGHLERWDFGHPGWTNERYAVRVLTPYPEVLDARVVAWTPSTSGPVRSRVVQITIPEHPTRSSLETYLDTIKDRVRGRIVLAGAHTEVPVAFNPAVKRREDSELQAQYDPSNPPAAVMPKPPEDAARPLEPREVDERLDSFLVTNGALVKISDSAREHGQIRVFANRTYNASKAVPSIVIRNEDYGRLSRIMADGRDVEMEIELLNSIYAGQESFNAVAEITGSDKKDQVVLLGAHMDSWHAGMGATDNATGVSVVMEAVRLLQKLGVQPRRTIRIALWGGEEQGLLGSKAYVREHFGTFESPGQEFSSLTAYVNLDSGTGRVRGASIFGPPESAAVLRQILKPFGDLGVVGVAANRNRSYGGTDSSSFSWAGLPGINLAQDPIEYQTHTWHTNLDTYERVVEQDVKQCAIVVASLAYHLAMREEMLPRFPPDSMPAADK